MRQIQKLWAIALTLIALPTVQVSPVRAQAQLVPAAVAACSSNPVVCAVAVTAAGWVLYYRNHPPLLCTWGGCHVQRMMQDPEAREEADSDYVWANDEAQARQMCERLARASGGRMDRVTPTHNKEWRNNWGKRKYTCYFTRYVGGH